MTGTNLVTAEELYAMGPDARFELLEGVLVEYPFHSGLHGAATGRLVASMGLFLRVGHRGELLTGQVGCILQRNPDTVLAPDLVFVRGDRLGDQPEDGFLLVVPDLVAEVLDPWDSETWIEQKRRIYLDAGVERVWIVDPGRRELTTYDRLHPMARYGLDDNVPSGDLLPGFELRIGDLFR